MEKRVCPDWNLKPYRWRQNMVRASLRTLYIRGVLICVVWSFSPIQSILLHPFHCSLFLVMSYPLCSFFFLSVKQRDTQNIFSFYRKHEVLVLRAKRRCRLKKSSNLQFSASSMQDNCKNGCLKFNRSGHLSWSEEKAFLALPDDPGNLHLSSRGTGVRFSFPFLSQQKS